MENLPRIELLQVAENVAREKSIEKEDVRKQWKKRFKELLDRDMELRET